MRNKLDVDKTLRNPLCEFALSLEDLENAWNYGSHGGVGPFLPFILVDGKNVSHDMFAYSTTTSTPTKRWTWETMNSDSSDPVDLRQLGVIPWPNGTWSSAFVIADAMAFKLIAQLLA